MDMWSSMPSSRRKLPQIPSTMATCSESVATWGTTTGNAAVSTTPVTIRSPTVISSAGGRPLPELVPAGSVVVITSTPLSTTNVGSGYPSLLSANTNVVNTTSKSAFNQPPGFKELRERVTKFTGDGKEDFEVWLADYYEATGDCGWTELTCTVIEGPSDVRYLPNVTPLPIELTCNVTGVALWRVNNTDYSLAGLTNGNLLGHSRTGTDILVDSPVNNTEYICVSQTNNGGVSSDPAYIIIAGVPLMVPNVMIDINYRLSWGKPFSNLDPIVSYTVSWNDGIFLQSFTTTDISARNYPIPNLTPITNYTFSVVATNSIGSGPAGIVIINAASGTPNRVPNVMINEDYVRINGRNVTLTLSWGESFSYFVPIISYTVSCSGDVTCPQDFTTTDNTTRSYAITNLNSMTSYTFLVVATNSFGSGEPGILVYPTKGISQVDGIELQCNLVNRINQCTVTWSWNSLQENIINFLVISNVGRFNVPSQNTSHKFPVLSLPGGAQSGEVTVIVIAVNEVGQGPPSEVLLINQMISSLQEQQLLSV